MTRHGAHCESQPHPQPITEPTAKASPCAQPLYDLRPSCGICAGRRLAGIFRAELLVVAFDDLLHGRTEEDVLPVVVELDHALEQRRPHQWRLQAWGQGLPNERIPNVRRACGASCEAHGCEIAKLRRDCGHRKRRKSTVASRLYPIGTRYPQCPRKVTVKRSRGKPREGQCGSPVWGTVAGAVPPYGHGEHRPNGVAPPAPTQWTVWAGGRPLRTVDSGHCPLCVLWTRTNLCDMHGKKCSRPKKTRS